MGSMHRCESASECSLNRKESDLARVTHKGGGTHQDTERRQPNEGHSPLETAEG